VSTLRRCCRFPDDLEMEVYAGIVGREAAVMFFRWCHDWKGRPVTADEVLDRWFEVAQRTATQRDDLQAATMNELLTILSDRRDLDEEQEDHLVAYLGVLPRDLRFGMVKSLLRMPHTAEIISRDKYDGVVLDAISRISSEVA